MKLVDALRHAGPPSTASATENAARREASVALYEALMALARRARGWKQYPYSVTNADQVEEASSVVACRLIESGPRGERERDPTTDSAVQAWLGECLKNELKDGLRRAGRADVLLTEDLPARAESHGDEERAARLDRAHEVLFGMVLPLASKLLRKDAADNLRTCLEELTSIRKQEGSLDHMALADLTRAAIAPTTEALRRAKLRRYKAYQRAIERALLCIQAAEERGSVTAGLASDFREALDELRLRP